MAHNRVYLPGSGPTVSRVRWAGLTMVMHLRRKVQLAFWSELLGGFCSLSKLHKVCRITLITRKRYLYHLPICYRVYFCECVFAYGVRGGPCSGSSLPSSSKWYRLIIICIKKILWIFLILIAKMNILWHEKPFLISIYFYVKLSSGNFKLSE